MGLVGGRRGCLAVTFKAYSPVADISSQHPSYTNIPFTITDIMISVCPYDRLPSHYHNAIMTGPAAAA
jgi:hypothetical protein